MSFDDDAGFCGIATQTLGEADDAQPTPAQVQQHLAALADAYGLPLELVQAVAQTESNFDTEKVRERPGVSPDSFASDNKAYGVMQVRDDQIGKTVRDADGAPFQIGDDIKSDWKANAEVGVALLAQHYQLATVEQPFSTLEERAQQTYSGYSAGNAFRDRYLHTLPYNDLPAHPDDRAFLQNLQDAPANPNQQPQTPLQGQGTQQANSPSGGSSESSPLPGPLQRLKENPGNLFEQSPPPLARTDSAAPSSNPEIASKPSLANVAKAFSSAQEETTNPLTLPAPLERLKGNPGDLFVPRSGFTIQSDRAIQDAVKFGYIQDANDFKSTILQAAAQNHISPNALVGLAARESSLYPENTNGNAKGLYQLLPARQQDLGIADDDVLNYRIQIPKVAATLRNALDNKYDGNFDLAIASWTLGDGRVKNLLNQGGTEAVRNALLDRNHPEFGRVGPQYIDFVKKFF